MTQKWLREFEQKSENEVVADRILCVSKEFCRPNRKPKKQRIRWQVQWTENLFLCSCVCLPGIVSRIRFDRPRLFFLRWNWTLRGKQTRQFWDYALDLVGLSWVINKNLCWQRAELGSYFPAIDSTHSTFRFLRKKSCVVCLIPPAETEWRV